MGELNKDILRWVLLIGTIPIWWPFLRALWRDFNNALREEGVHIAANLADLHEQIHGAGRNALHVTGLRAEFQFQQMQQAVARLAQGLVRGV